MAELSRSFDFGPTNSLAARRRAAYERDELAAVHTITSSARASSESAHISHTTRRHSQRPERSSSFSPISTRQPLRFGSSDHRAGWRNESEDRSNPRCVGSWRSDWRVAHRCTVLRHYRSAFQGYADAAQALCFLVLGRTKELRAQRTR